MRHNTITLLAIDLEHLRSRVSPNHVAQQALVATCHARKVQSEISETLGDSMRMATLHADKLLPNLRVENHCGQRCGILHSSNRVHALEPLRTSGQKLIIQLVDVFQKEFMRILLLIATNLGDATAISSRNLAWLSGSIG